MEKVLPSPDEVAEQAQALQAASVSSINVKDVGEMMQQIMSQAKGGDVRSARLILDHLNTQRKIDAARPAPPPPKPIAVKAVDAEPPSAKPVAIDGPGVEQHRRLVAFVLLAHQPMMVASLGQQTGLSGEQLEAVLNHDWFKRDGSTVRLTPLGKNAVG